MSIVPLPGDEVCSADNSPVPVVLHVLLPVPEWFLCCSLLCSESKKTSLLKLHHSTASIFWILVGFGQWQAVEGNQRVGGRSYQEIYFPTLVLCPFILTFIHSLTHGPFLLHCICALAQLPLELL